MYCENCGAKIDDDSKFCENCGAPVSQDNTEPESPKELEEMQPVTDINDLLERDEGSDFEETSSDSGKTMIFVKQEDSLQETQRFEYVPKSELISETENKPEPETEEQDLKTADLELGKTEPEDSEPAESDGPESDHQLFCMACGKKLPKGAAFCDACGTPTGEVTPAEIRKRRSSQSLIPELLKGFFVKPASMIEKAAAEDAFAAGIGFFLVKDVILAILSAGLMKKLTASLGILGSWFVSGDPFGFGAKIFLCGIILDALWIGILYGAGRLFKAHGSINTLISAAGTAGLFHAVLLFITIILAALAPVAAGCAILVTAGASLIFMTKAVAVSLKTGENLQMYMIAASVACYGILLYIVIKIIA